MTSDRCPEGANFLDLRLDTRSAALPGLDLPRGFRKSIVRKWVNRISSPRSRTMVARKLEDVIRRR